MISGASRTEDQAFTFVEVDGRNGYSASLCNLANGELVG
jgi:hypothetical protein